MNCTHATACSTEDEHQDKLSFMEKVRSLNIQTTGALDRRKEDTAFSLDMDAYKRLRHHGVQPKQIGGSAQLESQAMSKYEIEHGLIMSDPVRREFLPKIEAGEIG